MALSINKQPLDQVTIAYDINRWGVVSNDATIIRVIADVYINGVYNSTLEKSPNIGTTTYFDFDFRGVLQDNLSHHAPVFGTSTDRIYELSTGLYYNIRFFEVLDNGTTFDTSWAEDGAGSSYLDTTTVHNPSFAINATKKHEETQDLTEYQFGGTYGSLSRGFKPDSSFLGVTTNKVRYIKRNDIAIVNGYVNSTGLMQGAYFEYDSAGSLISTHLSNTITAPTSHLWVYSLPTTILASNATDILFNIDDNGGVRKTNYIHYKIVDDCADYVSLYWQNSVGGIDYYLFRDGQVKTIAGESETYIKPLDPDFNTYDFGTTVLSKTGNIGISAVSETIDRDTADWLSELFTHANRAWIYVNAQFIPVIIADGSISTINTEDGAYRCNIDLVYSNKVTSQKF